MPITIHSEYDLDLKYYYLQTFRPHDDALTKDWDSYVAELEPEKKFRRYILNWAWPDFLEERGYVDEFKEHLKRQAKVLKGEIES